MSIITLLISLLPGLITGADEIYALIAKITETLKTSSELTPEQQTAFDAHIADLETKDWWKPDA